MASTSLYRFRIDLSDIDRGVYEALDFRLAMHPSETLPYLLTRALAYCLNTQEGLEFSPGGLSDHDDPSIQIKNNKGGIHLWIEIGNPSAKKLHKASKAADLVRVYTYKNPELILREGKSEGIHRAEQIEIYALAPEFLDRIAKDLPRDVRWSVLCNEQRLSVSLGDKTEETEIKKYGFND
jgi:uncharacterized protein YaeQ